MTPDAPIGRSQRQGDKFLNPVPTRIGSPSLMLTILWLYLRNTAERSPRVPVGPFTTDPRVYAKPPGSGLRVTWFGHSSSLIEIDGARVLIDPVWDERAGPTSWLGPRRFFPPTLALGELPQVDLILLSHDHYDHLGAATVRALAGLPFMQGARWVVPLGVGAVLRKLGVHPRELVELDWTESTEVAGLRVTALPTRHFSGRSIFNRNSTLWASYCLAGAAHRVFYGADSGEWAGFAEIGRRWGPFDLSMLEIGAFDPLWKDIHMGPEGAARTFAALGGAGLLMPIHWGLFDLALHAWRDPIEQLLRVPGLPVWSPEPGNPTEVVAGEALRPTWFHREP